LVHVSVTYEHCKIHQITIAFLAHISLNTIYYKLSTEKVPNVMSTNSHNNEATAVTHAHTVCFMAHAHIILKI